MSIRVGHLHVPAGYGVFFSSWGGGGGITLPVVADVRAAFFFSRHFFFTVKESRVKVIPTLAHVFIYLTIYTGEIFVVVFLSFRE